jgi:hypothetical protein
MDGWMDGCGGVCGDSVHPQARPENDISHTSLLSCLPLQILTGGDFRGVFVNVSIVEKVKLQ